MKLLYVRDVTDLWARRALEMLVTSVPCTPACSYDVHVLVYPEELKRLQMVKPQALIVGMFTTQGNHPSRYLRMTNHADCKKRGFSPPAWSLQVGFLVALRDQTNDRKGEACMRAALSAMHRQILGEKPTTSVPRPKSHRKPRTPRTYLCPSDPGRLSIYGGHE